MKRTRRLAGVIALMLVAGFLVIGCGDSPTAPLVADDGDGGGGNVIPDNKGDGGAVLVAQDPQVDE